VLLPRSELPVVEERWEEPLFFEDENDDEYENDLVAARPLCGNK
jgi:hypothetical protein